MMLESDGKSFKMLPEEKMLFQVQKSNTGGSKPSQ